MISQNQMKKIVVCAIALIMVMPGLASASSNSQFARHD